MNSCNFLGRLVRDPEIKEFESGSILAKFTLAVDRTTKSDGEKINKADFIPFQVWGELAKIIGRTLKKGQKIAVYNCDIETGEYEDKEGTKHYTWWLNVGRFEYVEKKIDREEIEK